MEITAYTLPGCSHCGHLKELFKRANVDYAEVSVTNDITTEDFNNKYPMIKVFPFVVIDDKAVGGLVEVIKLFLSEGLISSTRS
jgi:glutaredoxin